MFAGNNLSGILKQDAQNAQGLRLDLDRMASAQKGSGESIEFELAETQSYIAAGLVSGTLHFE